MKTVQDIVIVVVGVALVALLWMFWPQFERLYQKKGHHGPQKACTLEARLCPDGSAVGRTGPNCEFAKCPGE